MEQYWNQLLYERAKSEYEQFISGLLVLPKEDILTRSYEKVYKEELVSVLETSSFSEKEAQKLCETEFILESLYQQWLNNEYSCVEFLEQTVHDLAESFCNERIRW